jgi:hypothetical protein
MYTWSTQFNNALPDNGGINDQNALVMQALSIVREEFSKVEAWRRHDEEIKREREAKRKKALGQR